MKYVYIQRNRDGSYVIHDDEYHKGHYFFMGKKRALQVFRKENNLQRKKLTVIEF